MHSGEIHTDCRQAGQQEVRYGISFNSSVGSLLLAASRLERLGAKYSEAVPEHRSQEWEVKLIESQYNPKLAFTSLVKNIIKRVISFITNDISSDFYIPLKLWLSGT